MVKNIENNGWTKNYTFYDIKARPIGTYNFNYLGGYTKTESNLDFAGIPQKTYTYHKRKSADNELQIKERFVYNQYNNALEKHFHNVNNQAEDELLVENTYNEIGQLTNKKVGGTAVPLTGVGISAPIQSVDYSYNIRGWMTGINLDTAGNFKPSKLFNYKINYNEPLSNFTKKPYVADQSLEVKEKFNGNISAVTWKSSVDPAATEKKYGYVYDPLNRLLAGFYYEKSGADFIFTEEYNELLDYDPNGNISHLKRFSFKQSTAANMIDDLNYTYENNNQSNRLQKIDDPSTNTNGYEGGGLSNSYDLNGNMTQMPDKGIITPIAYNFLNLPSTIKQGRNTTNYLYRADGTKLKKTFNFVNKMGSSLVYTEYLDGFQYSTPNTDPLRMALEEQDDETVSVAKAANIETFSPLEDRAKIVAPPENAEPPMILSFFPTAEGFYDYENFRYIYQYKDHLGNVRVSYVKDGSSLKVMDTNDYYPFGMSFIKSTEIAVYDPLSVPYNYKFQEQELQETGFYAFKWRQYMPDVGRFFNIDPLSEKYSYQSHYNFSENRVVDARELEGLESVDFRKTDGYKNVVIINFGYDGKNRNSGATQKIGPDDALVRIKGNSSTRVINYASSQKDGTKNDILGTINSFRKAHPKGNVILVGHSGGADNNIELAKENPKVKINLSITLDARDPKQTGWTDTNVSGNVDNAINYYQNTDKLNLVSDRTMDFSDATNGVNILSPGSNHRSIDNDQVTNVINDINNQILNNNPVENARNRKQNLNDPATSNSDPISK